MDLEDNEFSDPKMKLEEYEHQVSEMDVIEYEPQVSIMDVTDLEDPLSIKGMDLEENDLPVSPMNVEEDDPISCIGDNRNTTLRRPVDSSDFCIEVPGHEYSLFVDRKHFEPNIINPIFDTSISPSNEISSDHFASFDSENPDQEVTVTANRPTFDESLDHFSGSDGDKPDQLVIDDTHQPMLEKLPEQIAGGGSEKSDQLLLENTNQQPLEKPAQATKENIVQISLMETVGVLKQSTEYSLTETVVGVPEGSTELLTTENMVQEPEQRTEHLLTENIFQELEPIIGHFPTEPIPEHSPTENLVQGPKHNAEYSPTENVVQEPEPNTEHSPTENMVQGPKHSAELSPTEIMVQELELVTEHLPTEIMVQELKVSTEHSATEKAFEDLEQSSVEASTETKLEEPKQSTEQSSTEKTVQTEPRIIQRKAFCAKATQIFLPELDDQMDHSLLQPSLNLGVKNVRQILTCVQSGSLEVQDIMFNECSVIYECKVCRNLFRCLANLISHKRFYCKDSFSKVYETNRKQAQSDVTVVIEPESPPDIESGSEEMLDISETEMDSPQTIQISTPKIFTLTKESRPFIRESNSDVEQQDETFIHLEQIKSNQNAYYQTVMEASDKAEEPIVLPDQEESGSGDEEGKAYSCDSVLQAREQKLMKRSDCDIKTLTCTKCNVQYLTLKTLYMHMTMMHADTRVYYPCLYCKTTFAQMYGVSRHMKKAHNKNKEQFSRIRKLVRRRAFIRKGPFPTEQLSEKSDFETVAPPAVFTCSKCNRGFSRKSSQISHEKFCRIGDPPTNPTLAPVEPTAHKRKPKIPNASSGLKCYKCSREFTLKSSHINHMKFCKARVDNSKSSPTSSSRENVKIIPQSVKIENIKMDPESIKTTPESVKMSLETSLTKMKPVLPIRKIVFEESTRPKRDGKKKKMSSDFVSSQSLKWRSANKMETLSGSQIKTEPSSENEDVIMKKSLITTSKKTVMVCSPVRTALEKPSPQARSLPQVPQSRTIARPCPTRTETTPPAKSPSSPKSISMNIIEGRVYSIINAQKLSCLKCHRKFSTFSNLRRHAATHIGWMRFKCRHCNYQCFNRSDCRSHIQRMHPGSYTSPSNLDKNIMKLSTGKLNVRREDLMAESRQKGKTASSQEKNQSPVPATKETPVIKPFKTVPPVVVKRVTVVTPPSKAPPTLPVKSSARKSMGGAQRPMKTVTPNILQKKKPTTPAASLSSPKPSLPPSPQLELKKKSTTPPTNVASPKPALPPSPQIDVRKKSGTPPANVASPKLARPSSPQIELRKKSTSPQDVASPVKPNMLATTKPHVILLNPRKRVHPDSAPTLVTRAGTYNKTVQFIPPKLAVKQKNGQAAESDSDPSNKFPDHQYT